MSWNGPLKAIRLIKYEYNMWLLRNSRLYDGQTYNEMLDVYRIVVLSRQLIDSENL